MLKEETAKIFMSEDEQIVIMCRKHVTLGSLHDVLLQVKGNIVEKMVMAQKQEEQIAEEYMRQQDESSIENV